MVLFVGTTVQYCYLYYKNEQRCEGMLSEKEFYVLKAIKFANGVLTQRELADKTGYALGTISRMFNSLLKNGYIDSDYQIMEAGRTELDRFKVKNAVILAAGITSESNPIAKNIPKGLYQVKGEILIERMIKQLQAAGIPDIYVVVGFQMDQFFYLEEKYGVHLIANNSYLQRNNNGSIYCVRQILGNSYIIPNDEFFTENVFSAYEYNSYYASVYSEGKSKEAFLKLDDTGKITQIYKGGSSGWVMLGHCYMTRAFAEQYVQWLLEVYDRYETQKLFWEEIFYPHLKECCLVAKKFSPEIIYEFDELSELEGFDNQFFNNINPEIYQMISEIFNSSRSEITDIQPIKSLSPDILFRFKVRNDGFIFRYPGTKSTDLINYAIEGMHNTLAKECGADESFLFEDRRGYRISVETERIQNLDLTNCVELIKRIHDDKYSTVHSFDYRERIRNLYEYFDDHQRIRVAKFDDIRDRVSAMLTLVEQDDWKKLFSHNNLSAASFRECDNAYVLVDWEYSGANDVGYDIAALSAMFSDQDVLNQNVVSEFMAPTHEVMRHLYGCQAIACFYKFLLGIYYSGTENKFSSQMHHNWRMTKVYLCRAEKEYAERHNDYLTNDQASYVEGKIGEPILSLLPLTGGVTNVTYEMISRSGKLYALRIPGKGTNAYINRADEMRNIATIDSLGIMPRVFCSDPDTGILIMDFLEHCQPCAIEDVHNAISLQKICRLLYMVHTSEKTFDNEFDLLKNQTMYREHLKKIGGHSPKALKEQEERMDGWMQYLFLNYPKNLVTCHIDPKLNNFLKKGMQLYLIDWEYSGMADRYFEFANFALVNNLTEEEERDFIDCYCRVSGMVFDRVKYLLYKFATDYLWIYWHLIKCQQKSMVEYNEMSWRKRLKRAKAVLDELEKENVQ